MTPGRLPSHVVRIAQPPGVDLEDVVTDLADNGVAAPGDQAALAEVVDAARQDLQLSVVVVPEGSSAELTQLATLIRQERGGTVLVLSPESTGAASETYDDATLTEAVAGLPLGDVQATETFVAELTDPGPPWLTIVLAGAALLAAVAVGGRWWERRRQRRRDAAALAAEGARLSDEVTEMADEILAFEPQVSLRGDPELATEYSHVAVEYRELSHAVERDPQTRRDADQLSARVHALRERVGSLGAALNR